MKTLRFCFITLCFLSSLAFATPYDYGWRADLNGANERPTPNASPATGTWYGTLDGNCDTLSYYANWSGLLGPFSASHIHYGEVNQAGPVRHGLENAGPTGTPGGVWGPTDGIPFAPNWVASLYNDSLYVNVHSAVFPGGEIRGQIRCEPDTADFNWGEFGTSQCIQLCEDYSSFIRIWNVPPGLLPIVIKRFGCVSCEVNCYPANIITEFLGGVWTPGLGYVYLELRGNGCICVEFDGFLAVEVGSFDAVAGDGQVTLNWSTRSETSNDHFEVERDGQRVGADIASLGNTATGHDYSWTDRTVTNGRSYSYKLYAVDMDGSRTEVGVESVTPTAGAVVDGYALLQNYPNPFNPETNIAFDLSDAGMVTLKVYDMTGRLVATLVNGTMPRGSHTVSFGAFDLPSGLYVYRLDVNGFTDQKKMLLLK